MSVSSCPRCGRVNPASFSKCSYCGTKLPKTLTISTVASSSGERAAQVVSTTPRAVQDAAANVLAGTVTSVTSLRYEPPDFDVYRFVSQVIILAISLPILLALFVVFLALSLVAGILRLTALAELLNPFAIFTTMHFFALIFPFRLPQRRDLPVFSFRVRDDQGRDHQARIKGLIEGEYPGEGDQVELQGRWHNGTFIVEQGFVHNVGARFRVRPSRWRWVLFCFLFITAMVACFWAFTWV